MAANQYDPASVVASLHKETSVTYRYLNLKSQPMIDTRSTKSGQVACNEGSALFLRQFKV